MARYLTALLLALGLCVAQTVRAFDTGPHFDLTRDALAAEGFGNTASQVAQVAGWMTDLYAEAGPDPLAEGAPWLRERVTAALAKPEGWPEPVISAAAALHFDGTATKLGDGAAMAAAWDRLARATRAAAIERATANDPRGLLLVLGISLHAVQDFYAHSNWVDSAGDAGGPGWAAKTTYGSHPTWFDVPPDIRAGAPLRADDALNKDWPGRPRYRDAYLSAYFATRQWVQAMHLWVNNEPVWHATQLYADRGGDALDRDLAGAFKISAHAGHWQGQGEPKGGEHEGPGGNAEKLKAVLEEYRRAGKTPFRAAFETLAPALAAADPPPGDTTIFFTWDMQAATDFAEVRVTGLRDRTGKADLYAQATIAGQPFLSGILHGDDAYTLPPDAPFTFIKSVPAAWKIDEPVTTLRVEVATGNGKDAGTDDDVFLRVNDDLRFKLERPKANGFEKGARDTYALVPPPGLLVRDLRYLQLEKAPDGKNGNWQLKSVRLEVNGQAAYDRDGIDAMLAGQNLSWRAPDFIARGPSITELPVALSLYADSGRLANDAPRDIHSDFGRLDLLLLLDRETLAYRGDLSGTAKGSAEGGSQYGGKGKEGADSGKALVAFAFDHASTLPAQVAAGKITATLAAEPANYHGALPVTLAFNGTITVEQPCDVTYRFVRSDGAIMLAQSIHFDGAGTKPVRDIWPIKQQTAGWMLLKVEAPRTAESGKAAFDVKLAVATTPTPPPTVTPPATATTTTPATPPATQAVTPPVVPPPVLPGATPVTAKGITVSLTTEAPRYTGTFPVTITFTGAITVERAMDVKYHLVRSDGMKTPARVLRFTAAGTKEFKELWVQRAQGNGWITLQIDEPIELASNKAQFALPPANTGTTIPPTTPGTTVPPANTGTTVPPVTPPANTGTTATPPANTGTTTPPGATAVPRGISATLSVSPARYVWQLPAVVTFSGTITVDRPGDVTYRFIRSDGAITPARTLAFKAAGTKEIKDVWMFKQVFSGWMQLKIEAPLEAASNQAAFEIAPTDTPLPPAGKVPPVTPPATTPVTLPVTQPVTPPVTPPVMPPATQTAALKVTATLAADPAKYVGKYPAVVAFKGTITADGPGEVTYRFLRSDGAIMPAKTLRFDAAGTKNVQEFWVHVKPYAGWITLNILTPVEAESNQAAFEVMPESTAPAAVTPAPPPTPPATAPANPPATPPAPAAAKITAVLAANPAKYTGAYPAIITFTGSITVNAPGDVTYRFIRSDGAITPTRTITFKTAGTKEIKDTWVYKQALTGWMQLKIETPAEVLSNQAAFEVAPEE